MTNDTRYRDYQMNKEIEERYIAQELENDAKIAEELVDLFSTNKCTSGLPSDIMYMEELSKL